jgi:hypothetical protein
MFLDIINHLVFIWNTTFRRLDSASVFRWNLQLHASAALPSEKQTPYPLDTRLSRPQNSCASYGEQKRLFPLSGIELRSTDNYILRRMPSSGMCRRVDLVNRTNVSEERIASIFRVEKSASEEPAWAGGCRLSRLLPPSTDSRIRIFNNRIRFRYQLWIYESSSYFIEWTDACLQCRLCMYFLFQWVNAWKVA